jgi:hypothetical protein
MRVLPIQIAMIASVLACAGNAPRAAADAAAATAAAEAKPEIVRVVPDSGLAGTAYPIRVTIEGEHFADSTNTVSFGGIEVPRVPATHSGTRIDLFLPKESPSVGEVPPAILQPGSYPIAVTTLAGTSNTVTFVLTREPTVPR